MPIESKQFQLHKKASGIHYSTFRPLEDLSVTNLFIQKPVRTEPAPAGLSTKALIGFLGVVGLPERPVLSLNQVHGAKALMITEGETAKSSAILGHADAFFTNSRDFYLSVRVADCLPVYVYDFENKIAGLIHAGWRGTLLGIIRNSILKARLHFGLNPEKCCLVLGPCIKPCCYEVSGEVALLFPEGSVRINQSSHYLDLGQVNVSQLVSCGIPFDNIFVAGDCTFCNPEIYHSFRRTGEQNSRMYAVLGLK